MRFAAVALSLVLAGGSLVLAGCELFGGGAGRSSRGEQLPPDPPAHLDVTFVSRCTHPVVICYGAPKCLTLSGSTPHVVHAATSGNSVFVSLEGSSSRADADTTFSMIEVDASCAHLDRRLPPR